MSYLTLYTILAATIGLCICKVGARDDATLINNTRNGSPNMDRKRLGVTHHGKGSAR